MRKRILYLITLFIVVHPAIAATRDAQLTNTTGYNYNYMYPYMTNSMRTNLNPGVSRAHSSNLIDTVVKTNQIPSVTNRRVVSRSATNSTVRSAKPASNTLPKSRRVVARTNTVRSAVGTATARRGDSTRGQSGTTVITNSSDGRSNPTYSARSATPGIGALQSGERISSGRCLADYTECMNDYCERENTKYNRCYCSSRLAQIDSTYQPAIENLIIQLLTLQSTNEWSDTEMSEYWMSTVGKYGGDNSWENIDSALSIDWATMDSRVRGQNAFNTGHEYCSQHLRGCYYMASNMRDAYRSQIARDCSSYEQSLQRIKNAAESIIEANK